MAADEHTGSARRSYRQLKVWHKSMDLVQDVYRITADLPAEERFGLSLQCRRAAISIPSNIAEGYGRAHRREYVHHLSMARGSLFELETKLIAAVRLGLIARDRLKPTWELTQEIGRMLNRLIDRLRRESD